MLRLQVFPSVSLNTLNLKEISCTYRCVWCGAVLGQLQTSHVHLNADASKDTLSMQFHLSMVRGREVASERSEGADDRNTDAGVYFLNGRSPLRMHAASVVQGIARQEAEEIHQARRSAQVGLQKTSDGGQVIVYSPSKLPNYAAQVKNALGSPSSGLK